MGKKKKKYKHLGEIFAEKRRLDLKARAFMGAHRTEVLKLELAAQELDPSFTSFKFVHISKVVIEQIKQRILRRVGKHGATAAQIVDACLDFAEQHYETREAARQKIRSHYQYMRTKKILRYDAKKKKYFKMD